MNLEHNRKETKLFEEKGLESPLAQFWCFRILHLSMSFICFSVRHFFRLTDNSETAKYAWKHIRGNVILSPPRPAGTVSARGFYELCWGSMCQRGET